LLPGGYGKEREKEKKEEKGLARSNSEGFPDDFLKGFGFIQEGDFHPKEQNGDIARREWGESDGILFRGDEGKSPTGASASQGILHFGRHKPVVIGEGSLVNNFGPKLNQAIEEAFRHGDAGHSSNP